MDSEHRHELSSNEMVNFIKNLPDYFGKYYMQIIGVCIILIAILFSGPVKRYLEKGKLAKFSKATIDMNKLEHGKRALAQGQQNDMVSESALFVSANTLEISAQQAGEGQLSALLLIKRAEALRADLHYSNEEAEADVVADQIELAKSAYQKALAKAKGNANLSAKAEYGLGLCAEEVGDYAGAEEIYKKIVDNADYAVTIFPGQARVRLEKLLDNQKEFIFVDAPEEVVETVQSEDVIGTVKVVEPTVKKAAEIKETDAKPEVKEAAKTETVEKKTEVKEPEKPVTE